MDSQTYQSLSRYTAEVSNVCQFIVITDKMQYRVLQVTQRHTPERCVPMRGDECLYCLSLYLQNRQISLSRISETLSLINMSVILLKDSITNVDKISRSTTLHRGIVVR
jgi:site-specific recombinase XerD